MPNFFACSIAYDCEHGKINNICWIAQEGAWFKMVQVLKKGFRCQWYQVSGIRSVGRMLRIRFGARLIETIKKKGIHSEEDPRECMPCKE